MKVFFILLLSLSSAYAEVLLIPEKSVPFEVYQVACAKEGYTCTHHYFFEQLKKSDTPQMDTLIEDFDLLAADFRKQLPQRIESILKSEMISLEQALVLIQMIEKSFQFEKNPPSQYIQSELREMTDRLKALPEVEYEATSYVVFKKRLTAKQFSFLHLSNGKLFHVMSISAFALPRTLQSREVVLLSGSCESASVHEGLESNYQISRTQTLFVEECSFQKSLNQSFSQIKESVFANKTTLFWVSAAAVGTYLLLNQYQVELNF